MLAQRQCAARENLLPAPIAQQNWEERPFRESGEVSSIRPPVLTGVRSAPELCGGCSRSVSYTHLIAVGRRGVRRGLEAIVVLAGIARRAICASPAEGQTVKGADGLCGRKPTAQTLTFILPFEVTRHVAVHGLDDGADYGLRIKESILDLSLIHI